MRAPSELHPGSTRVVRLITRLNIGGPARQALMLTRELRPEYETLLAVGTPGPDEGELSDPEVEVRRVPLVRSVRPASDLAAYQAVSRLLRAEEPVLLHTHMAKAGSIGRMAALSSRSRPVLVHTFHGHVLEGYFRPSLREVFLRTERFLARRTDALIAVSVEIRDQLLELGIGSPDRWRVVPLGFDLEQMLEVDGRSGVLRERFGLADEPLVGVIGRLAPIKDHATLVHAVARLRGVHLAVLGDGELRGELEDLVATLRIADRVHFVGWLLDVPSAIADMDAVALTSRNEGTPVSLIEAHACGRPVVATDVGGVRSVVIDGSTGFLVPPKDATAVATCLEQVLSDRDLAKRMGAAGRDHVRDRFTQERLVSVIRSLYEELLR